MSKVPGMSDSGEGLFLAWRPTILLHAHRMSSYMLEEKEQAVRCLFLQEH